MRPMAVQRQLECLIHLSPWTPITLHPDAFAAGGWSLDDSSVSLIVIVPGKGELAAGPFISELGLLGLHSFQQPNHKGKFFLSLQVGKLTSGPRGTASICAGVRGKPFPVPERQRSQLCQPSLIPPLLISSLQKPARRKIPRRLGFRER